MYSFSLAQNLSRYISVTETFVEVKFHLEALYEKQMEKKLCVLDH